MKLYNVFIKQDLQGKIEDIKFLKDGISVLALLFTPLWFAYHKMWKEFFAVIFITIIFSYFASSVSQSFDVVLQVILCFIIAINANYWLGEFLYKKKKYAFVGAVFGKDSTEAKMNFAHNFDVEFADLNSKIISK
jgi:hypothetical protein